MHKGFWASLSGEQAKVRVQGLILNCLPHATRSRTLAQSAAALKDLVGSKVVSFAGASWQRIVKTILGYVQSLEQGAKPDFKVQTDPFLVNVKNSLNYFCVSPGGAGGPAATGAAAAKALFDALEIAAGAGPVTHAAITNVSRFGWLLDTATQTKLETIRRKHNKAVPLSAKDDTVKKGPCKDDTRAMVRKMFGK